MKKTLLLLTLIISVIGCSPAKQAAKERAKVEQYLLANPERLAQISTKLMPDVPAGKKEGTLSVVSDRTEVIPATDTTPAQSIRYVDRLRVDSVYLERGPKVLLAEAKTDSALVVIDRQAKRLDASDERGDRLQGWLMWSLGINLFIVGIIVGRLFKRFPL